jgi:hypothetical protein
MRDIEKQIQEKRATMATKKKLMGFTGKLGVVARNLGQPLESQELGGMGMSINYLEDPYALPDDNQFGEIHGGYAKEIQDQIPIMDMDVEEPQGREWQDRNRNYIDYSTVAHGWFFDGLSRGIHMEIKYDEWGKTLLVRYKGYEVYKEIGGELMGYAPSDEWEGHVDQLYKVAKDLDKNRKKQEHEEEVSQAQKIKTGWWREIKDKWGL